VKKIQLNEQTLNTFTDVVLPPTTTEELRYEMPPVTCITHLYRY